MKTTVSTFEWILEYAHFFHGARRDRCFLAELSPFIQHHNDLVLRLRSTLSVSMNQLTSNIHQSILVIRGMTNELVIW